MTLPVEGRTPRITRVSLSLLEIARPRQLNARYSQGRADDWATAGTNMRPDTFSSKTRTARAAAPYATAPRRDMNRVRMAMGYLYLNAFLYLLFALWCTASPSSTALHIGYLALSSGGQSEYLVVYGGVQLGLAVLFYLLARHMAHVRLGISVALSLYIPVVIYRAVTVLNSWPVGSVTLGTGMIEVVLLAGAVWFHRVLRHLPER